MTISAWLVGGSGNPINDLLNFFVAEGRRTLPGSDKSGHPAACFSPACQASSLGPPFSVGFHLDENIAGIKHLLRNDPLAASHFHNLFGRNQNVVDLVLELESLATRLLRLSATLRSNPE